MKVAIVPTLPFSLIYGGGETMAIKTMEALRKINVVADILRWDDTELWYDVIHLFGLHYWSYRLIELATGGNIPVIISTVSYVPNLGLKTFTRKFVNRVFPVPTTYRLHQNMINLASLLLPNSQSEAIYLQKHFNVDSKKICVIPNGVDLRFADAQAESFYKKYNLSDYVLCVGKIEPRKHQLELVNAFKGWNKKLVLIGDAISNRRDYFDQVMKVVHSCSNITHIPRLPYDSELLASAYAGARVHALLGTNETPGLVNLEAALAGCQLVVAECPPVREYLGTYANYCINLDVDSIQSTIEEAWHRPHDSDLKNHIIKNYTWEVVARLTVKAYERIKFNHINKNTT